MLLCQGAQNIGLYKRKLKSALKCTVWSRPSQTDRQTDKQMNIMAIARRFVLNNASRTKNVSLSRCIHQVVAFCSRFPYILEELRVGSRSAPGSRLSASSEYFYPDNTNRLVLSETLCRQALHSAAMSAATAVETYMVPQPACQISLQADLPSAGADKCSLLRETQPGQRCLSTWNESSRRNLLSRDVQNNCQIFTWQNKLRLRVLMHIPISLCHLIRLQ